MSEIRVSIAMATYNGEKYLSEQIESILNMMSEKDELVISDDGSTDGTLNIIEGYCKNDKRVIVVTNNGTHGVCGNFTNAVQKCSGNYVFLSDQDDLWINDKINKMLNLAKAESADLVICDGSIADEKLRDLGSSFFNNVKITTSPFRNLVKGRFWGCCMCFRKECFEYLLPFPDNSPHDIFSTIMVGLKHGKIILTNEKLVVHRVHGNNVTPKNRNSFHKIVKNRWNLFFNIMKRIRRDNE